jgi:hypothetical protein
MSITLKVTKIEVACRQLEAAINIYFHGGDPVVVHALVGGAYEIIRVLNKSRGGDPMANDLDQYLKGSLKKEFRASINKAENFLKHASRDPNETFELKTGWTETRMYEAGRAYIILTGENRPLIEAFLAWFAIQHSDAFQDIPELSERLKKIDLVAQRRERPDRFLRYFLRYCTSPAADSN